MILLALAVALPLLAGIAVLFPRLRPVADAAMPWTALPALLLGLGFGGPLTLPDLLLGLRLDPTDPAARSWLLFTGAIWAAATPVARAQVGGATEPERGPFWVGWCAGLLGMVVLSTASDLVGFYAGYVLMTYALYPLVAHDRQRDGPRAGAIYVAMAFGGEMVLLWALLLVAMHGGGTVALSEAPAVVAASPHRGAIVGLLVAGFGVKAALFPLHPWAPIAYAAAPPAAAALIGGVTLHAGLLAWIRLLPLGEAAMPEWGWFLACLGVAALLASAVLGLPQRHPSAVLAYSSVGQIGFVLVGLAVGLAAPHAAEQARSAAETFALHHALAKGALLLGVAVAVASGVGASRWLVGAGLVWAALELSGAPLTSGSVAKGAVEHAVEAGPWRGLATLLTWGTVGSALLAIRFVVLAFPRGDDAPPLRVWAPWASLLGLDLVLLVRPPAGIEGLHGLPDAAKLWHSLWPIGLAAALAVLATVAVRRRWIGAPSLPAGDWLAAIPSTATLRGLYDAATHPGLIERVKAPARAARSRLERAANGLDRGESQLRTLEVTGAAFAVLAVALALALGAAT